MKIKEVKRGDAVDFGLLKPGDCFEAWGKLYVKSAFQQQATGLKDGESRCNMCGINVIPVNAEIQIID